MDGNLLRGVELHPLVRLAIDAACFSHDDAFRVLSCLEMGKGVGIAEQFAELNCKLQNDAGRSLKFECLRLKCLPNI